MASEWVSHVCHAGGGSSPSSSTGPCLFIVIGHARYPPRPRTRPSEQRAGGRALVSPTLSRLYSFLPSRVFGRLTRAPPRRAYRPLVSRGVLRSTGEQCVCVSVCVCAWFCVLSVFVCSPWHCGDVSAARAPQHPHRGWRWSTASGPATHVGSCSLSVDAHKKQAHGLRAHWLPRVEKHSHTCGLCERMARVCLLCGLSRFCSHSLA